MVDGKQVKISGVSSKEPNGTGRTQKHTRLSSMEAVVNSLGCVCTRNNVVARAQQRRRQAGGRALGRVARRAAMTLNGTTGARSEAGGRIRRDVIAPMHRRQAPAAAAGRPAPRCYDDR